MMITTEKAMPAVQPDSVSVKVENLPAEAKSGSLEEQGKRGSLRRLIPTGN